MANSEYTYPPDVSMVRRIISGHFDVLIDILNSADYRNEIRTGSMAEIAQGIDDLVRMMAVNKRMYPDDWCWGYIQLPDAAFLLVPDNQKGSISASE